MSQTKAQLIDPVDGTIVNADINASAAIAASKIADFVTGNVNNRVLTASGTANSLIGEAGMLFTSDSNDHFFTLTGSGQAHLQLISTSGTDHCSIDFGDSDDNDIGEIRYTHSTNNMQFDTNAILRMTLDSEGRLLLGTTTEGNSSADNLTVAGSGNVGITIRSGTAHQGAIYFSDATSGNAEFDGFIGYTQSNQQLFFGTAESTRVRIDSTGRISAGKHGLGSHNDASEYLKVQSDDTSANISIVGSNDTHSTLNMGDEDDFNIQKIKSDHTNNSLQFFTVDSERLRINSAGQLLSGTTSSNSSDTNALFAGGGNAGTGNYGKIYLSAAETNPGPNTALSFIGTSTNNVSNNAMAFIGVHSDGQHASSDYPTRFGFFTTNAGASGATEKMRIHSGGTVNIPAGVTISAAVTSTSSANTLDDYEEGTWSPGGSWDNTVGVYTKIGRVVHAAFRVRVNTTGSANMQISNLPYASANNEASRNGIFWGWNEWDSTVYGQLTGNINPGTTEMNLYRMDGSGSGVTYNQLGNDKELKGVCCYQTAT